MYTETFLKTSACISAGKYLITGALSPDFEAGFCFVLSFLTLFIFLCPKDP